jgi:hypothetical protein
MSDKRYTHPVAGLGPDDLAVALRQSVEDVARNFPPHTGICVFVFDFGKGGGMGFIANSPRDDMVKALREFLNRQARGQARET